MHGQRLPCTERVLDMYRMVSHRFGRVCRRGYDLGDGWKWAHRVSGVARAIVASPSVCADAVRAVGVAVHGGVGERRS
jgi:hypothetical protein